MKKSPVCVYLDGGLMDQARALRRSLGVPFSRLVTDGVVKEIEKYKAINVLVKQEAELVK